MEVRRTASDASTVPGRLSRAAPSASSRAQRGGLVPRPTPPGGVSCWTPAIVRRPGPLMKGLYMTAKVSERLTISPEDVDPRHDWKRPLRAPGVMNVDFEERVDFRRLHRYRLGPAPQALRASQLRALLVFDNNNKIGRAHVLTPVTL